MGERRDRSRHGRLRRQRDPQLVARYRQNALPRRQPPGRHRRQWRQQQRPQPAVEERTPAARRRDRSYADHPPFVAWYVLEDEAYERSIIGGSDGMLKLVLQKRLPERWGDPPKTINQNLSLRLMSPEQREEEAGRILLRIAALGIPLISIDG